VNIHPNNRTEEEKKSDLREDVFARGKSGEGEWVEKIK